MKIEPPPTEKSKGALPLVLGLLAVGMAVVFYLLTFLYYKNPGIVPDLRIENFAGTLEVSHHGKAWHSPNRGDPLKVFDEIRTGAQGELDFQYNSAHLRLKENSELRLQPPPFFSKAAVRLHLIKGRLLVSNQKDNLLLSVNPSLRRAPKNFFEDRATEYIESGGIGIFTVVSFPEQKEVHVASVRGRVDIMPFLPGKSQTLKEMQMLQGRRFSASHAARISQQEWRHVREAYEITPTSGVAEAAQKDLSKKAGDFFKYVFDHGTFYQQQSGWCEREFVAPEDGSPVYLETTYDVFPTGSWVGVYLKTRNLDLSQFQSFQLEARAIPGRAAPAYVKLEFKSKGQVVQGFAIKHVPGQWDAIEFPLHVRLATPITELTIIFSNDKVGEDKSGGIQLRNFSLKPAAIGTRS